MNLNECFKKLLDKYPIGEWFAVRENNYIYLSHGAIPNLQLKFYYDERLNPQWEHETYFYLSSINGVWLSEKNIDVNLFSSRLKEFLKMESIQRKRDHEDKIKKLLSHIEEFIN